MPSIPARLKALGTNSQTKDSIGYYAKENGEWKGSSFGSYYQESLRFAKALLSLDFNTESKISILAFNRPEWVVADVGTMLAGGVPAGIYQTCSPEEISYIISHSESAVVVVENEDQWVEDTINIKGGVNLGVLLNSKLSSKTVVKTGSGFCTYDVSNCQDII